jgi:hypothetical protein
MEGLRLSNGSGAISLRPFSSAALPFSHLLGASRQPSHGIPAKGAKMDTRCGNCERQLAFLPSCASLYCEEPDDAPAVARCFAGAFGREPKGEPQ